VPVVVVPASDLLARLVATLESSLVMYLADCGIGSYPGPAAIREALADLVRDQRGVMGRASELLEEREIPAPRAAYPLSFTGLHDIDLRHLVPRITADLARQADACDAIARAAAGTDAAAATLAAAAAATTRQHAERLGRPAA
jgi:hypothetical protein